MTRVHHTGRAAAVGYRGMHVRTAQLAFAGDNHRVESFVVVDGGWTAFGFVLP